MTNGQIAKLAVKGRMRRSYKVIKAVFSDGALLNNPNFRNTFVANYVKFTILLKLSALALKLLLKKNQKNRSLSLWHFLFSKKNILML